MRKFVSFVFLLVSVLNVAQTKSPYLDIDTKISKIPVELSKSTTGIAQFISDHFKSDNEKIRAVFYWTATNISYDVANMNNPNQFQPYNLSFRSYSPVFNIDSLILNISCIVILNFITNRYR